ncbi:MAG: hypothetical protein SGJ27_01150 [Candidatus Melainabacteria bacterium]|nr:hypothetical protein [Candidatus Melainabacteria bacterium]
MVTKKRQISFYAEPDIDMYLTCLDIGIKSRAIIDALRLVLFSEARVDLDDGKESVLFKDLTEHQQNDIFTRVLESNDGIWQTVKGTSNNWKHTTARFLSLFQKQYGEPYRICEFRSQDEVNKLKKVNSQLYGS